MTDRWIAHELQANNSEARS